MIEEPHRWVEAIANRREYIEGQLAGGSPIVALSFSGGILLVTLSRGRRKIFEIYDRIAMGGIGHPGDIERLRMTALEVASAEGFTRSAEDVSLRRLADYSLSPLLKSGFEQVYGPPFLSRLLFVELGRDKNADLFIRLEYDGTMYAGGGDLSRKRELHGILAPVSGKPETAMERYLSDAGAPDSLNDALRTGLEAWCVGRMAAESEGESFNLPESKSIVAYLDQSLQDAAIEAAVIERGGGSPVCFRSLSSDEISNLREEDA